MSRSVSCQFRTILVHLIGDADGNGLIQPNDAALVLQAVVRKIVPGGIQSLRMDASGNGTIFSFDASLILRKIAGLITTFPAGSTYVQKPVVRPEVLPSLAALSDDQGLLHLTLNLAQVTAVHAAGIAFTYDPARFRFEGAEQPEGVAAFLLEVLDQMEEGMGTVRLALAGTAPLESDGALVRVRFRPLLGDAPVSDIVLT